MIRLLPTLRHAQFFASESRVTKISKITLRLGFTFKKFLKLKFCRDIIFHGSSDKNQQKPPRGWPGHPSNQFGINSLITCNICDHRGIYKKHRPRVLRVRRNFSVKTDRWAAAVVAIDQLRRKIAGVTDTKRQKTP